MVISWIFFVSIGILLSRYYRYLLPTTKLCGVEFWFFLHRIIMIFATVCTIIAFCVVLGRKCFIIYPVTYRTCVHPVTCLSIRNPDPKIILQNLNFCVA